MPSPRAKLALLSLIPIGVLAVTLGAFFLKPADEPGSVIEISGPMPVLEGEWLNGGPLTPSSYRGKVVLVNFWGTWCGPCRREQPVLQRLAEEYEGRVQFVGVDFLDDQAAAREFLREFGVTYPSVVDDGPLGHRFGVPYAPATFLVDRTGEMRYQLLGEQEEPELRRYIEELLRDG
ncbi:MAG: TlpA family protein disulfide reductase [Actinomycetota bacterium]